MCTQWWNRSNIEIGLAIHNKQITSKAQKKLFDLPNSDTQCTVDSSLTSRERQKQSKIKFHRTQLQMRHRESGTNILIKLALFKLNCTVAHARKIIEIELAVLPFLNSCGFRTAALPKHTKRHPKCAVNYASGDGGKCTDSSFGQNCCQILYHLIGKVHLRILTNATNDSFEMSAIKWIHLVWLVGCIVRDIGTSNQFISTLEKPICLALKFTMKDGWAVFIEHKKMIAIDNERRLLA